MFWIKPTSAWPLDFKLHMNYEFPSTLTHTHVRTHMCARAYSLDSSTLLSLIPLITLNAQYTFLFINYMVYSIIFIILFHIFKYPRMWHLWCKYIFCWLLIFWSLTCLKSLAQGEFLWSEVFKDHVWETSGKKGENSDFWDLKSICDYSVKAKKISERKQLCVTLR